MSTDDNPRAVRRKQRMGFSIGKETIKIIDCPKSGKYLKITLTQDKFALADVEEYEKLSKSFWWVNPVKGSDIFYARGRINGKYVKMHNYILGKKFVDHKNSNGLDNRKSNLRPSNNSLNAANQRKQNRLKSSKFKGVHWCKQRNKWRAQIQFQGKRKSLFSINEDKAAELYDRMAIYFFGEFAKTNFGGNNGFKS